jgi:metal-responsive CopG/Arc/MetJ family transcriptional regulator
MVDTVKIDDDLLKRVERLIEDKFKKIKYGSRKQFINYAVIELLEKEEKDVQGK